jgi:hypothetical protein
MGPWNELRETIEAVVPRLRAWTEEEAAAPYAPGKWPRKVMLGHLIDSATNNHVRFVRAQLQDALRFPGYAQDEWVRVQHYASADTQHLVELWYHLNLHLAHVMEQATVMERLRPRREHDLALLAFKTSPSDAPATLQWFMQDYVDHLQHHLRQILS